MVAPASGIFQLSIGCIGTERLDPPEDTQIRNR
jgi:hypothetical protein